VQEKTLQKAEENAGVVAPPPLIYLGGLLAGLWLQAQLPMPFLPRRLRFKLGWPLVGLAVALLALCMRQMRQANTSISVTEPTTELVTEGPYRFSRNPIYIGLTFLYSGLALLFNSFWAVVLLPVILRIMNKGVIQREELYLEKKFGQRYQNYKAKVARWF
jgi:protein-S-isoprenylcysteine O-methyltransferase Ste14